MAGDTGRNRWLLTALAAAGLLLAVAGAAFYFHLSSARRTPAGQPPLAHLELPGLDPFLDQFNRWRGMTRVVLMLSPT